ncbi:response regulator transcription factor [Paraburkholderia tropica]|uniref:response regulator transcription factor n=1 Tax=Paraburkholderia tropica TaxID=92647 RepID=UPI00158FFC96|nr:response regulator transcription factor [Paraburkholderia tropica]
MKFAVLTNDRRLFNLICLCFLDELIECSCFSDDVALTRAIYREDYQAIIVDAATGVDPNRAVFARRACYDDRRAPLIVVGAFDGRADIEQAFDAGADDVVRSPIDRSELAVRTHLARRRFEAASSARADGEIRFGPYRLDRRAGTVQLNGRPIRLTVREFAIAWLLFSRTGEYVSRRTIAGAIWSSTEDIVGRTLEQHIYKLRKKLELNGEAGVQLRTMYAHGYRIEMGDEQEDCVPAEATQRAQKARTAPPAPALALTLPEHDNAPVARPTRVLDVHHSNSEAARQAQPWAVEATDCAPGYQASFNADFTAGYSATRTPDCVMPYSGTARTDNLAAHAANEREANCAPALPPRAARLANTRRRN